MKRLLRECWELIDSALDVLIVGFIAGFGLTLGVVACIGLLAHFYS